MKTIALHEVILSIKNKIAEMDLSQKAFQKLVFEKTGVFLSDATVSRLYAKGSESKGFNYKSTLEPAQRALMGESAADNSDPHALYESALLYKDAEIEDLNMQIEAMRQDYERKSAEYRRRIDDLREEYEKRIEYVQHQNDAYIAHLCEQINIKDKRIDWRDDMIKDLMDQVKVCGHCPWRKRNENRFCNWKNPASGPSANADGGPLPR